MIEQEIFDQKCLIISLSQKLDSIETIYDMRDALNILEIKFLEQEFQRNQIKKEP